MSRYKSSRNNDNVDYNIMNSDEEFELDYEITSSKSNYNNTANDNEFTIDKILGLKYINNNSKNSSENIDELYLIKWRNKSYLHISWERREDLEKVDAQGKSKIKRFLQTPQAPGIIGSNPITEQSNSNTSDSDKLSSETQDDDDIEYFNPEFVDVQRIISCDCIVQSHSKAKNAEALLKYRKRDSDSPRRKRKHYSDSADDVGLSPTSSRKVDSLLHDASDDKEQNSYDNDTDPDKDVLYLVKWRGLPYNECSWERWGDIRDIGYQEVWKFWQLQRPPKIPTKPIKFPSLQEYKKLEVSPVFGVEDENKFTHSSSSDGDGASGDAESWEEDGLRLRDYQLEGVNWLLWNWWHKRPCILADEMGLGKTIQTVAFLHQLRYMKTTQINGPFLIIAPLSLADQWLSEVNTWSPSMNCVLMHGNIDARNLIITHELYYNEPFTNKEDIITLKKKKIYKINILLTTYEVAIKELKTLCKINWKVMIIDEAHKLKNSSAKMFTALNSIPRDYCVLLTGTPLQNKTEELWALLNFSDEKRFNNMNNFMLQFGDLKESSQIAKLHEVLKPYLLRRIKEDVEKSLPPKEETIIEVSLTTLQKKFYKAIYEKNTVFLYKGLKSSNQPSLINVMMELRKCCNHPYLVKGVEERVLQELNLNNNNNTDNATGATDDKDSNNNTTAMDNTSTDNTSNNNNNNTDNNTTTNNNAGTIAHNTELIYKKLIESSGKLVLLDKLLPKLYTQGHKVLIFSQMVKVLNLLEDFLIYRKYTFERLDGSTKPADRKDAVSRFCKPSCNKFIMLMSTKAGGLGLNLTAADTVIIFDSDWNPQNDLQAQARAHRIGQTKAVMVYRLLTKKTYEMEMFHQASMKLGLDRAVLAHARNEQDEDAINPKHNKKLMNKSDNDTIISGGRRSNSSNAVNMNTKEIDELLKRGAYDVFREDDTEQQQFEEADIDTLLQRNSRKVHYNSSNVPTSTLGNFSKASFVSADEKESIDINDPDFWKKAVGLNENNGGILNDTEKEEEVSGQRIRKQTKQYDTHISGDQLDQLLRPIRNDKNNPIKKENLLKERQLREEAKQQKLLIEAAKRNDPMTWNNFNRDRVLRSLNNYGFGRWIRIESDSGGQRNPECIEQFARVYIYQLGIIASENNVKSDTDFIKDAIKSAKKVKSMIESGEQTLQVPPCLEDTKFITKLRNGQARKILLRLESLAGMVNMIQETVEKVYELRINNKDKDNDDRFDPSLDLDTLVNKLSIKELCSCLPLGDVRPEWSSPRDWWDVECDKHLILGTFKYGYGNYNLMRDDNELIFREKLLEEAKEMNDDNSYEINTNLYTGNTGTDNNITNSQGTGDNEESSIHKNDVIIELDPATNNEGETETAVVFQEETKDKDVTDELQMPDARALNRLFSWLVTSDVARQFDDVPDRKSKNNKTIRHKKQTNNKSNNATQRYDIDDSNVEIADDEVLRKARINIDNESPYMTKLYSDFIEEEAFVTIFKSDIRAIQVCESVLTTTEAYIPVTTHDTTNNIENIMEIENNDTTVNNNADSNENINNTGDGNNATDVVSTTIDNNISDDIAIRLSAVFILYGVPLEHAINNPLPSELINKTYNWEDVLQYADVEADIGEVKKFYIEVWLPFCFRLSCSRKNMTTANNKFISPNPNSSVGSHHYAARGLCQLFLIRHQVRYAVFYVLSEHYNDVLDYLRSNPLGRNTDMMPVWWCPWIHDIAVLLSIVKYGYISYNELVQDESLPFTSRKLEEHIRMTFNITNKRYDTTETMQFNENLFENLEQSEIFLRIAMMQFPDMRDLEARIIRILEDLTWAFPRHHPLQIRSSCLLFATGGAGSRTVNPIQPNFYYNTIIARNSLTRQRQLLDTLGSRTLNASVMIDRSQPPMALSSYLKITKKRRRYAVDTKLPNRFCNNTEIVEKLQEKKNKKLRRSSDN